jgi:pimeloyl-ACP methyl ester carboxylesterase
MQSRLVSALKAELVALEQSEIEVVPAQGQGGRPPEEQALGVLRHHPDLLERPSVLVGHSTGGLTARVLATHCSSTVKAVITIGTPHHGTELAENAVQRAASDHDSLGRVLKLFGYDLKERARVLRSLTPQRLVEFNLAHPVAVPTLSLCGNIKPHDVSWPLRALFSRPRVGDGLIGLNSQRLPSCLEQQFELDHLSQMGYHFYLTRARRQRAESEFERMVKAMAKSVIENLKGC